ncbi:MULTISPECIES: hypothetical protein [Brevibacillus]|uniref:Uncharacterized protein n=1 Tax=Brevibacillus borstelensis AK1 TaxID=1300222 RepID=M8DM89_9BACL|nr:hypothetical protein [Brevibacillus borstelensis]EMT54567.1 hypothetical protein I532_03145 [Brevibacillus borstelensis AK1]KKX54332.1 hypothetical protein X546_14990 [Brevibacillus borstelensis cifa_chp40]MBE5395074.1 hypothetical protein [Brevibacillus borstelensis]MED1743473.1 hypothetical protein [Brevibacillus borstelensis]MED1881890.1 hypothetical protein [Brevibacillus borstelensis]
MTEEEWGILYKLGFRMEEGKVKHLKLGVVKEIEDFSGFDSLSELEAFAKECLRTRCLVNKQKKRDKRQRG